MADTWRVLEDPMAAGAAGEAAPAGPPARDEARGRPSWLLLVAGIAIVAVAALWLIASGPSGTAVAVNAARDRSLPVADAGTSDSSVGRLTASASQEPLVIVEVNGAVRRPGIYRLLAGSRVGDAITAAGGYGGRVDAVAAQALNLAAKVGDGQQIHVPIRGERAAAAAAAAAAAQDPVARTSGAGGVAVGDATGPVNVNTASSAQLEALPGIGPATAAKIIAARTTKPFAAVDDLRGRKVVGAATLEKIRDLVVTR